MKSNPFETDRARIKEERLFKCGWDRCHNTPPKERWRTSDRDLREQVQAQKPQRQMEKHLFERRAAASHGAEEAVIQVSSFPISRPLEYRGRCMHMGKFPEGTVQVGRHQVMMRDTGERMFQPQQVVDIRTGDSHERRVVHRTIAKERDVKRAAQRDAKYMQ